MAEKELLNQNLNQHWIDGLSKSNVGKPKHMPPLELRGVMIINDNSFDTSQMWQEWENHLNLNSEDVFNLN